MKSVLRYAPLCLAVMAVHAQAQSVSPAWNAYREQQTQGTTPATQPSQSEQHPAATEQAPQFKPSRLEPEPLIRDETPYERTRADAPRSAFFVGIQAGNGWLDGDVKQDLVGVNAGYRWQAGPVVQIGIEAAAGKLKEAAGDEIYRYGGISYRFVAPEVEYRSLGATARFNFGVRSPVYGIARLGYWYADVDSEDVYGAYVGLGLGVDMGRHFNVNLIYNTYIYAEDYDVYDYSFSRADTLTFGLEVRF